jgi:hypothetical protein
MRFFDSINKSGQPCPICNSFKSGRVILVPIPGTQVGNKAQARQIHEECAELVAYQFYLACTDDNADDEH